MSQDSVVYLTAEGLDKLKKELEYLKFEKRSEIAERLRLAIQMGDLSENADYAATKEEQSFVEGRIRDLEDSLRRAKLITGEGPRDRVRVGCRVTVVEEGSDEEETYHIVGVHEANPSAGRISNESPFGRALLGAKVGQRVAVEVPRGEPIQLLVKRIV